MGEAARDWRPSPDVDRAIRNAWGYIFRRRMTAPWVDRDEMLQVATIAVWRAGCGDAPEMAGVVARRAMISEMRLQSGRGEVRGFFTAGRDDGLEDVEDKFGDAETPDQVLQARQMVARLAALPAPWPARIDAIVRHADKCDAAAELGVSPQRVSQYLGHLRQVLAAA